MTNCGIFVKGGIRGIMLLLDIRIYLIIIIILLFFIALDIGILCNAYLKKNRKPPEPIRLKEYAKREKSSPEKAQ